MLDWVEAHSDIEGAIAASRNHGEIIEAYGELRGTNIDERMVDIIKSIFTSTNPYLLDSSHFAFEFRRD